jgi:hypothetical protein
MALWVARVRGPGVDGDEDALVEEGVGTTGADADFREGALEREEEEGGWGAGGGGGGGDAGGVDVAYVPKTSESDKHNKIC